MHDGAKLVRRLVVLEQRRAGKRHKGRIGQRLLHADMVFTALAAVTFVDEHNNVSTGVHALRQLSGAVELLDQRKNDAFITLADLLSQARAGSGHSRLAVPLAGQLTARGKRFAQLALQINPVGDHHNAALLERVMQDQSFAQKNHSEGLARAGCMPDDPTLTTTIFALVANPLDQPLDAEDLLIASDDFSGFLIEQGEVAGYLQQTGRGKQADNQLILTG